MGEVSNKTLATLLIAAIVVSLVGTLISLNKVNNLMSVTGMLTDDTEYGDVNVSINASAGILIRHNIDFGSGQIPEDQINLSTDSLNLNTGGFNDCTGTVCAGMDVENVGNVPVELNVSFSKAPAAFLGGTLKGGPAMYIQSVDGDQDTNNGGCQGGLQLDTWTGNISAATDYQLCDNLTDGTGANFVTLEVNITLPGDATGGKGNNVTMTATELI